MHISQSPQSTVSASERTQLYQALADLSGSVLGSPRADAVTAVMLQTFQTRKQLLLRLANLNRLRALAPASDDTELVLRVKRDKDGRHWIAERASGDGVDESTFKGRLRLNAIVPLFPHKALERSVKVLRNELDELAGLVEIAKDAERVVAVHAAYQQERSGRRLNFLFLLGALAQLMALVSISSSDVSGNFPIAALLNLLALVATIGVYRAVLFREQG